MAIVGFLMGLIFKKVRARDMPNQQISGVELMLY